MDLEKYTKQNLAPSVRLRQAVERKIVDEIAKAAIAKGWVVRVFDGEEFCTKRTQDLEVIHEALMSTDEDQFFFYPPHETDPCGWVHFVYGNDGHDVASDWTVNLEDMIGPIVEKYQ